MMGDFLGGEIPFVNLFLKQHSLLMFDVEGFDFRCQLMLKKCTFGRTDWTEPQKIPAWPVVVCDVPPARKQCFVWFVALGITIEAG